MGVGVFKSNFNGTGYSIIVSDEYVSEEEFNQLVASGEVDKNVSFETFTRDNQEDFDEYLRENLQETFKSIGYSITKGEHSCDLESRMFFREIAESSVNGLPVTVALGGWQDDYIIGVGIPSGITNVNCIDLRDMVAEPDQFPAEIFDQFGMDTVTFFELYQAYIQNLKEYTWMSLSASRIETRFKTSGWTTDRYQLPEDHEKKLNELRDSLREIETKFKFSQEEFLANASNEQRVSLIKDALKAHEINPNYPALKIAIAAVNRDTRNGGSLIGIDPIEKEIFISRELPEAVLVSCDQFDADGFSIPSTNDDVLAELKAITSKQNPRSVPVLWVTAEEYMMAATDDLVIKDQETGEEVVLAEYQSPDQSLAMSA